MPKGVPGCFVCGGPTDFKVTVWLRHYSDETYSNGCRKQVTVDHRQRAFCAEHAEDALARAIEALARPWPRVHGCARCGERAEARVQVWMTTTTAKDSRSVFSTTSSYCDGCVEGAFAEAVGSLDGPWRHTFVSAPGTMEHARARQAVGR